MLKGHSFLASPLFLWPRKPRCWPHAFWQSCTRGRLGALSNDACPIADNEAPRWHARFCVCLADEVGRRVISGSFISIVRMKKKQIKKNLPSAGGALRPRPALPRQSSASGREIAEKGRLAGHIGLVFHIGGSPFPADKGLSCRVPRHTVSQPDYPAAALGANAVLRVRNSL